MSQIGAFYQIEKDNFDWVYARIVGETASNFEFLTVASKETISIPQGNQREIQVNTSILEILGVEEGLFNDVYILPTYHFFGKDFEGCCNPIYGFQVFPKADYNKISYQMKTLLNAAKEHYSHVVDLNYDKDEFIRKRLSCIFNVNQLFDRLRELGVGKIDQLEVLRKAENTSVGK